MRGGKEGGKGLAEHWEMQVEREQVDAVLMTKGKGKAGGGIGKIFTGEMDEVRPERGTGGRRGGVS